MEAIGRGAEKAGEIAARLQIPQTQLSKTLQVLLDNDLISKSIPFGESTRTSKKSLYRISDPALRFWFYIFSPQRNKLKEPKGIGKLT